MEPIGSDRKPLKTARHLLRSDSLVFGTIQIHQVLITDNARIRISINQCKGSHSTTGHNCFTKSLKYSLLVHSSFIQAISDAPLQVHYYSEALPIQHGYCVGVCLTSKRHRQLRVKDLPKVPAWRPEQDSNLRPFRRKAMNLPMSHRAPRQMYIIIISV